jgi:hypothetical protein
MVTTEPNIPATETSAPIICAVRLNLLWLWQIVCLGIGDNCRVLGVEQSQRLSNADSCELQGQKQGSRGAW